MNRRSIVQALVIGTGLAAVPSAFVRAQGEATPDPASRIPPIRWRLTSIDTDDSAVMPDQLSQYWVQFIDEGTVFVRADCNSGSGRYKVDGNSLTISDIIMTLAFCGDDSIDQDLLGALMSATAWSISADASDELALTIGDDGAIATFAAALPGVVWEWEQFAGGNDSIVTPTTTERYTLEFADDDSIQVVADCNTGNGSATIDGSQIELAVATTRVACGADSSSDVFLRLLDEASSFVIRDGRLHLALPMDAGIATFRAVGLKVSGGVATPEA